MKDLRRQINQVHSKISDKQTLNKFDKENDPDEKSKIQEQSLLNETFEQQYSSKCAQITEFLEKEIKDRQAIMNRYHEDISLLTYIGQTYYQQTKLDFSDCDQGDKVNPHTRWKVTLKLGEHEDIGCGVGQTK